MKALTSVSNRLVPAQALTPRIVDVNAVPVRQAAPKDAPAPIPQPAGRWVSIVAAGVILTLFSVLFYHMFQTAPATDATVWERLLLLYNSVQTIVVAAVSALLGFQVSAAQTSAAIGQGVENGRQAEKLRANIKTFQAELARQSSQSERGFAADEAGMRDTVLARAMLLLH